MVLMESRSFSMSFLQCTFTNFIRIYIFFCVLTFFELFLIWHIHFIAKLNTNFLLLYTFWCHCVCSLSQMEILMDDGIFRRMEIDYWNRETSSIPIGCRPKKSISICFRVCEIIYQSLRQHFCPFFCFQTQSIVWMRKCCPQA